MIGVVAGVGPYAGLDLLNKILSQTIATRDQDHLTVASISQPAAIPERTAFLLGNAPLNPAVPILDQLRQLASLGATVAGIPCNTAHAPPIIEAIVEGLAGMEHPMRLLHMLDEVGRTLRDRYPSVQRVGLLATVGTIVSRAYPLALTPVGIEVMTPDGRVQEEHIQPAIFDPQYGIKACGYATDRAREDLLCGVEQLAAQGAQAVILGCTELPLALTGNEAFGLPLVDSTLILARALIAAEAPHKLRPWPV